MNDLQEFGFEGKAVRVVMVNNEPWWVLKDVCDVLGLSDASMTASRLDEDELTQVRLVSGGQNRDLNAVNESGLYTVILRSDKPEAKRFRKWVTAEVLPAIRKTGSYSVAIPRTFAEALQLAADQAKELEKKETALAIAAPKAEFYDAVTGSSDTIEIGMTAKVLNMGIGRNKLFDLLRKYKVLRENNEPYQRYIDGGLFRVIETKFTVPNGDTRVNLKTVVYQKGVDFIRKLVQKSIDDGTIGRIQAIED